MQPFLTFITNRWQEWQLWPNREFYQLWPWWVSCKAFMSLSHFKPFISMKESNLKHFRLLLQIFLSPKARIFFVAEEMKFNERGRNCLNWKLWKNGSLAGKLNWTDFSLSLSLSTSFFLFFPLSLSFFLSPYPCFSTFRTLLLMLFLPLSSSKVLRKTQTVLKLLFRF